MAKVPPLRVIEVLTLAVIVAIVVAVLAPRWNSRSAPHSTPPGGQKAPGK